MVFRIFFLLVVVKVQEPFRRVIVINLPCALDTEPVGLFKMQDVYFHLNWIWVLFLTSYAYVAPVYMVANIASSSLSKRSYILRLYFCPS